VQEAVLRCVVAGANVGGGLWWSELMMEVACMHACVGPTSSSRADSGAPSSDPMSCISLFFKKYCSNGPY
jgi:hypothetical protein